MLRYEKDDYTQEHVADDDACVNTVASWRVRSGAHGQRLLIDLHNGWTFDSDQWRGRDDVPARLLAALRNVT